MFRSQTDYEKMKASLEKKLQSSELKQLVKLNAEFAGAATTPEINRLQGELDKLNKNLSTPEYKVLREQVEKVVIDYEKKYDALFKKALKMRAQGKNFKKSSKPVDEKKVQKILEKKFVLSGATHSTLSSQDESRLQLTPTMVDLQKKIAALHWLQKWSIENSMIFQDKLSVATLEESKQLLAELKVVFDRQAISGSDLLTQESSDVLLNRINNQIMEIEKLLQQELQISDPASNPSPVVIIEDYHRKETREALKAVVPEFESYWSGLMEQKQLPGLQASNLRNDKSKIKPAAEKAILEVASEEPVASAWKTTKRSDAHALSQFGLLGSGANAPRAPVQPELDGSTQKLKK